MRDRLLATLALTATFALHASAALASAPAPFDIEVFDKARKAEAIVVVDFHATWCPTCRRQAPLLKALSEEKEFADTVFLVADFDKEKGLKRALRVNAQSTIVVYQGDKEVARAIGVVDKDALRKLIQTRAKP